MENETFLSKLIFYWVTPLMEKGVRGSLKHSDDLYDLPESITTASIVYNIDKHIRKTVLSFFCFNDLFLICIESRRITRLYLFIF